MRTIQITVLEWGPRMSKVTWKRAKAIVSEMGNGWRLPTAHELHEAISQGDKGFGPTAGPLWTIHEVNTILAKNAVTVHFPSGFKFQFNRETPHRFRPVRTIRQSFELVRESSAGFTIELPA